MSDAFLISGPVLLNQDGTYTFADGEPAETTKCVVRIKNLGPAERYDTEAPLYFYQRRHEPNYDWAVVGPCGYDRLTGDKMKAFRLARWLNHLHF